MTSPGRSPPRPKKESSADADEIVEPAAPVSPGRQRLEDLARTRPHPTLLPGVVTAGAVAAAADALETEHGDHATSREPADDAHEVPADSGDADPGRDRADKAALRAQAKVDRLAARRAKREERRRRREERHAPQVAEAEPDRDEQDSDATGAVGMLGGAAAVAAATDPKALRAEARARRREEVRRAKQAEAEQARLEAEEQAERAAERAEQAEREAAERAERERVERAEQAEQAEREAAEQAEREAAEQAAAEQAATEIVAADEPADQEPETAEHTVIEWTDPDDDPVVEPPPAVVDADEHRGAPARWRRAVAPAVLTVAMLALVASVVLAVGALLAAISADTDNAVVGALSSVSDVLDGPLGGLVSFSGENALDKERLLSRGIASMVFLAIGVLLPLAVSSKDDED